MNLSSKRLSATVSLTMFAVLLLPLVFYFTVDQALVNNIVQQYKPKDIGEFAFSFLILSLLMSMGLPRQIAAFSSGYLLGTLYGTFFATLAASLACLLTFFTARFIFHQRLSKQFPKQLATLNHFFTHDVFVKAFIIRLIPAGSNFLTNVLAGTAKAPLLPYLAGTMFGFIPQMLLFAMLGAGIQIGDNQQIILSVVLLLVAGILAAYLYQKKDAK
ncbi:TVP38/TMEM64 family protein [Thalassotalea piscium]|uniref:TVP38/TMEM64 family membrane protein n=1 Tax=Thalassotalea piscium TaxID=1230533 RepID=A0A7X0NG14_9GAMM|nr:VTT domain-containing protein [Thalassotalea piscium]MBB6542801.1 putative membrane protein YdjX (TVP38/TMEM64 family) [Thalassotalea piscium]